MNELFDANARDRALIRSVLVVGGTTAGWMTACYLKRAFPGLQISLLEAHDQESWEPPQGTRPDFQSLFFDVLGVSEDEWMRCCAGSFRVATKHQNWRLPASETPDDYYYQLFEPMPDCDSLPLSHYWVQDRLRGERQPMAYACHKEPRVLDVKLAPRYRDGSRAMSYAWHVDSQLLTTFLQRMAVDWGVQRIPEELGRVELTVGGAIRGIVTTQGNALSADLFVDCSGARRALAGALREPFIDMSDHLACDQVMTSTFSNDDALEGVDPYTSTIALSCGWAWKIPRLGRFDAGYVHCSQLIGAAEAAEELCSLWGFDQLYAR